MFCTSCIPLQFRWCHVWASPPLLWSVCLRASMCINLDQYRSRVGTFHGIYYGKFASSVCYITIGWVYILLNMLRYISSYLKYSRHKPPIGPLIGKANITVTITLIIIFAQFILKQCGDIHPNPGPQHVMSNNVNGMSICHANVNGIKDNLRHIRATLAGQFAIIALTETHLNRKHNIDLSMRGYYPIFRKDRHGGTDSWGGVGAYVASSLFVKRRLDLEVQHIENMWLEIRHSNFKFLLCVSYRPPNSSVDFWGDLQYQIDLAKSGNINHVVIVGDLNADPSSNHGRHLTRMATNNNFTIHVTEPTRYAYQSATILDQIITNIPHLVLDATIQSPVGSSDHHCVSCKIKTSNKIRLANAYTRYVWDYAKGNFPEFRDELLKTDWNECFHHDDLNTTASSWNEIFIRIAEKYIPHRLVTIRPKDKPWYHSRLRNLKRKLDKLHRKAKSTNDPTHWSNYRTARNEYCRGTRQAEEQYNIKLASSLQDKPASVKQWWKLAKQFLGLESDCTYPPISTGGDVFYNPKDKANAFNNFFLHHSDIDTSNAELPSTCDVPAHSLTNITVTESDVTDLLKNIDISKATGPDGISPRLLKEAGNAISKPLSKLFNLSLEIKTVPEVWKRANVIPIYKKGEKTNINNYRPISLLSCVGKLCERVVFKYVFNYFRNNFLLSIYQSGFQPGDSTVNQLIKVYHMLCEALDSKKEVRIVFCDISKAFDRVWHDGLVYKLRRMGIRGPLLSWFIHYLKDRQQRVVIQGSASEWGNIKAGVPHGPF